MGVLKNTIISRLRMFHNPGSPENSDYDVILPQTSTEAVFDAKTGERLDILLDNKANRMVTVADIPLCGGWQPYGSCYYLKDGMGMVHIVLNAIKEVAVETGECVFVLPEGHRIPEFSRMPAAVMESNLMDDFVIPARINLYDDGTGRILYTKAGTDPRVVAFTCSYYTGVYDSHAIPNRAK